ncbi:MAG: sigma-70 family RNA polymerase sigma factor [Nitrospirae bacterium]|nr:sigma-70 family RNA polymerase sigma factor [Nitrospirota bacterium]
MTNELEFHQIYEKHKHKILRYLMRFFDRSVAEELSQDVFLKVSNSLKDFKGKSQISTWIYRIATNTALDKLRSTRFQNDQNTRSTGDDGPVLEDDILAGEKVLQPDRQFIRKEMNECIRDIVNNLPLDYRTVIVLGELEELKNKEIADVLGLGLDTVKIRLHRARAMLKKALESHCDFYRDERNEFACDRKNTFLKFRSK